MKIVILTIAFIGYVQCAKLDHLKYLPPNNRPVIKEKFDAGLAAPTSGLIHGSFANGPQTQEIGRSFDNRPQTQESSFGKSTPFGSQPAASTSFIAGSQKAAQLQSSPFIPHGGQPNSAILAKEASQPQGSYSPHVSKTSPHVNVQPAGNNGFQPKYETSSLNQVPIIRMDTKNDGDGTYSTSYETGNGIQAEEQGQIQGDSTKAQGSFSYTSPEGEKVGVSYTADEDGYHPQGEHLPTPPPVPHAILKSLEYNMAHPEEENDDGSYKGSNGEYEPSVGKTRFFSSSNKYTAPKSAPGSNSQFLDGYSNPSESKNLFAPSAGSDSFPSLSRNTQSNVNSGPSVANTNHIPQPAEYSSSSFENKNEERNEPSAIVPESSNNAESFSRPNNNQPTASASGYQYNAPSSFEGSFNRPSTSSNKQFPSSPISGSYDSKSFQGPSFDQPTQNVGLKNAPSTSFNAPSNAPSGLKSENSFGADSNNFAQGAASSQSSFKTYSSIYDTPADKSVSSFGPSYSDASNADASSQSNFKIPQNGPSKGKFSSQTSHNAPDAEDFQNSAYGTEGAVSGKKLISGQYETSAEPLGQQTFQKSYFSNPNTIKSSQFKGYQYNAPNTSLQTSALLQSEPNQGSKIFPNNQFESVSGQSKIPTNFSFGESRGLANSVKTPGVQTQDNNGGYVY